MKYDPITMFLNEVKEEMTLQETTAYKLAQDIGCNKDTLYPYFNGRTVPSLRMASRIAKGLGMKVIICLGEDDD